MDCMEEREHYSWLKTLPSERSAYIGYVCNFSRGIASLYIINELRQKACSRFIKKLTNGRHNVVPDVRTYLKSFFAILENSPWNQGKTVNTPAYNFRSSSVLPVVKPLAETSQSRKSAITVVNLEVDTVTESKWNTWSQSLSEERPTYKFVHEELGELSAHVVCVGATLPRVGHVVDVHQDCAHQQLWHVHHVLPSHNEKLWDAIKQNFKHIL